MSATGTYDATTITHIWLALGGPEPKHGRARAFYRDGDNRQAVSLNDAENCWYDPKVRVAGVTGEATESSKARTVTFAISRAVGIDVDSAAQEQRRPEAGAVAGRRS